MALAERRASLVRLGLTLFGNSSYEALSIDAIAAAAGISKGLLYHYFPSKRAYYLACVEAAGEELLEVTRAAIAGQTSPLEQLHAGLAAYLGYIEQRGDAFTSLLRGGVSADSSLGSTLDRVRSSFVRLLLEHLGTPATPLLQLTAEGYVGFVETVAVKWLLQRQLERDELQALLLRAAFSVLSLTTSPG